MADFVWIHNPDINGVSLQPALAVDSIWVKKGFRRLDVDLAEASQALGFPVTQLDQLPEDYVRAVAGRPAHSTPTLPIRNVSPGKTPAAAPAKTARSTGKETS